MMFYPVIKKKFSSLIKTDELELLYDFLYFIQKTELQTILTQDIFIITPKKLPYPLENIAINISLDHNNKGSYCISCLLTPKFENKIGFVSLGVDLKTFDNVIYRNSGMLILDNNMTLEYNNNHLLISSGKTELSLWNMPVKPNCLNNINEFISTIEGFFNLIDTVLNKILPACEINIDLNIQKIGYYQKKAYKNLTSNKIQEIPLALKRVLDKAKEPYTNNQPLPKRAEKTTDVTKPQPEKAIDYSIPKNRTVPEALKRVIGRE